MKYLTTFSAEESPILENSFSGEAKEALTFDIIKRKEKTHYNICWFEKTALAGGQTG